MQCSYTGAAAHFIILLLSFFVALHAFITYKHQSLEKEKPINIRTRFLGTANEDATCNIDSQPANENTRTFMYKTQQQQRKRQGARKYACILIIFHKICLFLSRSVLRVST